MSEPFVGEIRMFAGNFAPRGWAFCDGSLLAVSSNDALFSLFGTIYGGDGRTTFGLPDLRGRIPIHAGNGPGLTDRRLGAKSGQEAVTLTTQQLPAHGHTIRGTSDPAGSTNPVNAVSALAEESSYGSPTDLVTMSNQAIGNNSGGQSHTNLMPFLCVSFIVALVGIYPSRT